MGQQVAACATVNHCCTSAEKGTESGIEPKAVLRADLHPEVRLVAWFRRRSGPDCDFGEVFEELFGNRDAVGASKFASILKERGADIDAHLAFERIDASRKGAIGAAELEAWQEGVEKKEVEGLRLWRDWLRKRYATPSAAFHAMGKGEGDVLIETEFTESLLRLGFDTDHPLELFRFVDKDFSGEITFAEFKTAMRSVGLHRVKDEKPNRRASLSQSSKNASPRQQQHDEFQNSDAENASEGSSARQAKPKTAPGRRRSRDETGLKSGGSKEIPGQPRRKSISESDSGKKPAKKAGSAAPPGKKAKNSDQDDESAAESEGGN